LIDARKGVLTQTRRHSYLATLLGIKQLVLAINKMDLVDYDQDRFNEIVASYRAFASYIGVRDFTPIPMSGLKGDNVTARGDTMPWYRGPTLLEHLEQVPVGDPTIRSAPFRMAVQWVNRPDSSFRGYAGTIASGEVRPGDRITVHPSGQSSIVERIVTFDGDLDLAIAGQAVTLTFNDEIDCSRGDMIAAAAAPISVSDRIEATIVWMTGEAMVPGRAYWLKVGTQTVSGSVARVEQVIDVNTMARIEGRPLELNDIGRCELVLDRPVAALAYPENRRLGGFILVDRATHATVAAGMIDSFPAADEQPGATDHAGRIIWLAGRSVAEKRAFALKAQQRFEARGRATVVLDEDGLRAGLSSDLGRKSQDEAEHLRRIREVARLISRSGVTVLVAVEADHDADLDDDVHIADASGGGDWII
jgi:bifunctional enzyme CysN/CysC